MSFLKQWIGRYKGTINGISQKISKNTLNSNYLPRIMTFDAYNTPFATLLPIFEQYCMVGIKYGMVSDLQQMTFKIPKIFKDLETMHPNYAKDTSITPYN